MNTSPGQSRADEVWRRFVGMFGGDAVERRYGRTPPPEWIGMLSRLTDFEVDRGIRRLAYSGREGIPSLPAFTKLCRTVQDDSIEEGTRPQSYVSLPDPTVVDRWEIDSNNRLLAHILRSGIVRRYYSLEETDILVAYKKAWTTDMREGVMHPETGVVASYTATVQQQQWDECMRRAESRIDEVRRENIESPVNQSNAA